MICKECHHAAKRRWRERKREIASGEKPALKTGPKPDQTVKTEAEPLTAEALGSRRLLEAYARYYERHVKNQTPKSFPVKSADLAGLILLNKNH